MSITCITGDIGSGKSHYMLKIALRMCNQRRKYLVTNFRIDEREVIKYCNMKGYNYVAFCIKAGRYTVKDCNNINHILSLLSHPRTVVCIDEAGVFFNARNYRDMPSTLLSDLAQSRKGGTDLVYAAQFDAQVDKQFRMLTQYFVHAAGSSRYDRKLYAPRLHWRCYFHLTATAYHRWSNDYKMRGSFLKSWLLCSEVDFGPLTKADKQLFNCFKSFDRIDQQATYAKDCKLIYSPSDIDALSTQTNRSAFAYRSRVRRFLRRASGFAGWVWWLTLTPKGLLHLIRTLRAI